MEDVLKDIANTPLEPTKVKGVETRCTACGRYTDFPFRNGPFTYEQLQTYEHTNIGYDYTDLVYPCPTCKTSSYTITGYIYENG